MNTRALFGIAILGIIAGLVSVFAYNQTHNALPPIAVNHNPYKNGIYATGIVESFQANGSNINIFPEVSGRVVKVWLHDGDVVKTNDPILQIDDSVQKQNVARDLAQLKFARANLITVQAQWDKIEHAYRLDSQSISKNDRDNALNAVKVARANVESAQAQYRADSALLQKYVVRASVAGRVLRMVTTVGDYVSPQGAYDTYTQSFLPIVEMGEESSYLAVRTFVDEILIPNLPDSKQLTATLFIRGKSLPGIPLEFVRTQPYTIPNIELSAQRTERVDVRVLPILFKFKKPENIPLYRGQLVDVYLKGK